MARYMPRAGVELSILTARNPVSQHGTDAKLVRWVPDDARVHYVDALEPPLAMRRWLRRSTAAQPRADKAAQPGGRDTQSGGPSRLRSLARTAIDRLLFPDSQILWAKPAVSAAVRLIQREKIGHVILTLPPFSLLSMAAALRRKLPELRIILDFRDDWIAYHLAEIETSASAWKREQAARLEAEAVRCADVVVTVTESWVEGMRRRYPREAASKFVYSPNGYDRELIPAQTLAPPAAPPLVIGYMGTVYANQDYSPAPFLDAVDAMPAEWRGRVETRFFGRVAPEAEALVRNRNSNVVCTGFLPQEEAFERLGQSHGLLLTVGSMTKHSAKLFEYLAMKIPILAISPPAGEVGKLMREIGAGWCVAPEDREGIQAAVRELYGIASGAAAFPRWADSAIARYDRGNLIAEMVRDCGMLGG
jgi:hypothetical protein